MVFCAKDFLSVPAGTSVLEAGCLVRDGRTGFVIVAMVEGKHEEIATESDFVAQVAQMMAGRGIRRGLVVKDGKILGVIEAETILAWMKAYVERVSAQIARTQTLMF